MYTSCIYLVIIIWHFKFNALSYFSTSKQQIYVFLKLNTTHKEATSHLCIYLSFQFRYTGIRVGRVEHLFFLSSKNMCVIPCFKCIFCLWIITNNSRYFLPSLSILYMTHYDNIINLSKIQTIGWILSLNCKSRCLTLVRIIKLV